MILKPLSMPWRSRRRVSLQAEGLSGRYARLRPWIVAGPFAWNGSWNDAPDDPSAAGADSAMACSIGAASALGARGHTSCKRQVSGSIPLTGSQAFARSGTVRTIALGESARPAAVTAVWPREATLLLNGAREVRFPSSRRLLQHRRFQQSAARDEAAAPGPEQLSAQTRTECSFRQLDRPWRGARDRPTSA